MSGPPSRPRRTRGTRSSGTSSASSRPSCNPSRRRSARLLAGSPPRPGLDPGPRTSNGADAAKRRTSPRSGRSTTCRERPKTPFFVRGDYLHPGPEVTPGRPVRPRHAPAIPLDAAPQGRPHERPSAGVRRVADPAGAPADGPRPGQSALAASLRRRDRLHARQLRREGDAPSHPELLDWLATEFVARGWSIKAMHRLMMTSSAYRQSSRDDPDRAPARMRSTRTTTCSGGSGCAGSTPRRSAIQC